MSSGLIARQIQELDESFAVGPALQLSLAVSRRSVTVDCVCLYSFWFIFLIIRRRCRVVPRLPEEPEELFVQGQALSLLMF